MGRTEEAMQELSELLRSSAGQGFEEQQQATELLDELRAVRSAQSG